jgi:hypothetical protein
MWEIAGPVLDAAKFLPFTPAEVLYDFDGPRVFTLYDNEGELNLAYWSDEDDAVCRHVVVPTTPAIIAMLRKGRISLFDALNQPRCWLCDLGHPGSLTRCQRVDFDAVPRDALPAIGTMLLPTLEPLLTLRAEGKEIVEGQIPGSVVRACIEGVQRAFKVLSEYVLGQAVQSGRPKEFLRRLSDLPTQRFAFASFEVSFRMPIEELNLFTASGHKSPEVETLEEVGFLLNKGLKWLTTAAGQEGVYSPDNAEEGAVVLRALKEITPSSQGCIERLELKGQLIGLRSSPLVLDRSARQRVNAAIKRCALEPQPVDLEGRIGQLDKDRLSFELRDVSGATQAQRFVFGEELLEEVFQAFQDDARVKVAGMTFPVKNLAYALAVSRVTGPNP